MNNTLRLEENPGFDNTAKITVVRYYSVTKKRFVLLGKMVEANHSPDRVISAYDALGKQLCPPGNNKKYYEGMWKAMAVDNEQREIETLKHQKNHGFSR